MFQELYSFGISEHHESPTSTYGGFSIYFPRRTDWWFPATGVGAGKMGEGSRMIQAPSYKIRTSQGCNVQHDGYSYLYRTVYLNVAKRVHRKSSHHKKNNC